MNKGASTLVSVILLLFISISLIVAVYSFFLYMSGTFKNATEQQSSNIAYQMGEGFKIEDVVGNTISIKNTGRVPLKKLNIYLDDSFVQSVDSGSLQPGAVGVYNFTSGRCVTSGTRRLRVTGVSAVKEAVITVPAMYCIDAYNTPLFESGVSYLEIGGHVYLNDVSRTPYASKAVSYSLVQLDTGYAYPSGSVVTDTTGNFAVRKQWNFTNLYPKMWWDVPYEYDWTTEFWSRSSDLPQTTQPSWVVSSGGVSRTLNPVQLKLLNATYNETYINKYITPIEIANDHATFNVTLEVNVSDPALQPAGTDAWIGMALIDDASSGVHVECYDTSFAKCHPVSGRLQITGMPMDVVFSNVSDISLEFNITNPMTEPLLVTLVHVHVYKYINDGWRPVVLDLYGGAGKIMPGNMNSFHATIPISNLNYNLQTKFPDDYAANGTNGTYMIETGMYLPISLVGYGKNYTRIYLNSSGSQYPLPANTHQDLYSVMWNFSQPVSRGIYNLSFKVTYPRMSGTSSKSHSADSEIFAFFNSTGNAVNPVYTWNNVGSSFADSRTSAYTLTIPDTNAVDTLGSYTTLQIKNVEKVGENGVKLKVHSDTYLMNFGSNNINNVIVYKKRGILNSSGYLTKMGQFRYDYAVDNTPPGSDEIARNYVQYRIGYLYDYIMPNVSIFVNDNFWRNETSKTMSCSGLGCSVVHLGLGNDGWDEVTNLVSGAQFKVTFVGNPGNSGDFSTPSTATGGTAPSGGTTTPTSWIYFVPPTDADGASINRNYSYVNVSINSANDVSAFIDWNRSLAGYWSFDSYNTTHVYDNSTYNNNATIINNPQPCNGKYGKAFCFNAATGDRLNVITSPVIKGNFTVESWVSVSDTGVRTVIGTRSPSDYGFDFKLQDGNRLHGDIGTGTSWLTISADVYPFYYVTGRWYHVAYVVNNTGYSIYVNGTKKASGAFSSPSTPLFSDASHKIAIGSMAQVGSEYFNGAIDEVRVWNRTLSPEEINASYNESAYQLYHNFTNLSLGTYTYYAYAIDSAGNSAKTETRALTVDTTAPQITINSPASTTYTSNIINFSVTLDKIGSWCGYSLIDNILRALTPITTMTKTSDNSFSSTAYTANGQYTVTFSCNDTAGNMNNAAVSFTVNGPVGLIKIQPWVQYTKTAALWQNMGTYRANFITTQADPYLPVNYNYIFTA